MDKVKKTKNINKSATDEEIKEDYKGASEEIINIIKKYKKDISTKEDEER